MALTLFCLFLSLVHFSHFALSVTHQQIQLPPLASGPESIAFESIIGETFFTGVNDGRIIKYGGSQNGFTELFATTSPKWSWENCAGNTDVNKNKVCGRPMGLAYNSLTNILYIADAYFGLMSVNSTGGNATALATSAEGHNFVFLNGLDKDPNSGVIYFTDMSSVYDLRNVSKIPETNDTTGRLMKYDPDTKQVTVLMRDLQSPSGVSVTADSSAVIVSEFYANRTRRFWLTGSKAGSSEEFLNSIVRPNNIKRTTTGQLSIAAETLDGGTWVPAMIQVEEFGTVLNTTPLWDTYGDEAISEAQTHVLDLYIGSRFAEFITVFKPYQCPIEQLC